MAVREAVANAVIHRDYQITSSFVQIEIFDDRLEISNPGGLPPGVTIENILDAQVTRNQTIANFMRELGYLEEYGRGMPIIFEQLLKRGLLLPILRNTASSFKIIFLGEKVGSLNVRQRKLWEFLIEYRQITPKQCREVLVGVPRPTINYDLRKMKESGLIVSKGKSNNLVYHLNY